MVFRGGLLEGIPARFALMHVGSLIHSISKAPNKSDLGRTDFQPIAYRLKKINTAIINLSTKQKGVKDVKKRDFRSNVSITYYDASWNTDTANYRTSKNDKTTYHHSSRAINSSNSRR
ncbi:hypothetical protein PCORN_11737 [Listeria cornellensis FSL F6-0969]|uniref:Uncharacterized protein n=1 Tax=Listeria cornellensis FSL F6-0969 TaxID=1265820 RepID=W7C806_9LIST|nr:hypothetical protein PCORN_11737 [Listeria cornellensis FSL F6-0969]